MSEKFEQENGRTPSINEIEEETELDRNKISMSLASTYRSVSLENPIKDEDASCLLDIIPNNNSESVVKSLEENDLKLGIEQVLSKLPYREQDILRMSFGIGVQNMTNDEIANRFGIGSERVRQLQHSAIKRIRSKFKNELLELV